MMVSGINKVFVYGTLLQGESLCHHMADCKLLRTLEIPGALYDTYRGYPTAVFDKKSNTRILGELYIIENPAKKIIELDELEMTESAQYERLVLNHAGEDFYTYQAGAGLEHYCRPMFQVDSGNWRRHLSLCFSDPVGFALAFEERQKYLYREPVTSDANGLVYIPGELPIMLTAPHASVHERMGKLKRQEFYTGALSVMLHALTGCHVLYSNRLMTSDPNYCDDSPFKVGLADIVKANHIKLLVDIHGTGPQKDYNVYPGIGKYKEFLLGNNDYLRELELCAEANGVSLGGLDVFPAAKQMTIAKYAARALSIPSIQLEINRNLREPEKSPDEFIKLIKFLKDYVERLSYLIS